MSYCRRLRRQKRGSSNFYEFTLDGVPWLVVALDKDAVFQKITAAKREKETMASYGFAYPVWVSNSSLDIFPSWPGGRSI